jgi:hypothetical protein
VVTLIQYPKIPFSIEHANPNCIGFLKYDGTNVGVEWTDKERFTKFTLRKRLLDPLDPQFGPVVDHIHSSWDSLSQRLSTLRLGRVTVFGEYWSEETFAGNHLSLTKPQDRIWTPFDIYVHEKDRFVGPMQFVEIMDGLSAAQAVFRGKFTGQIAEDVRHGKFTTPSVTEGVIFKGDYKGTPWAFKIKTNAYLERLQTVFGRDWQQYV